MCESKKNTLPRSIYNCNDEKVVKNYLQTIFSVFCVFRGKRYSHLSA